VILATKYIRKWNKIKICFGAVSGHATLGEAETGLAIAIKKIRELLIERGVNGYSVIADDWLTNKAHDWFDVMPKICEQEGINFYRHENVWEYEVV